MTKHNDQERALFEEKLASIATAIQGAKALLEDLSEKRWPGNNHDLTGEYVSANIGHAARGAKYQLPSLNQALLDINEIFADQLPAGGAVPALTDGEREDLWEFYQAVCCDAGHRVDKEGMRRLAAIGAVESVGFGKHRLTEFGTALLAAAADKYLIGELTFEKVFKPAGLTNLSDLQAVFDSVEAALIAQHGKQP